MIKIKCLASTWPSMTAGLTPFIRQNVVDLGDRGLKNVSTMRFMRILAGPGTNALKT